MFFRLLITVILVVVVSGPGSAVGQEKDQDPAFPQVEVEGNSLTDSKGPVGFSSFEGDFKVRFPGGCSMLRERTLADDFLETDEGPVRLTVHAFCNRQGRQGEGCSVTAYVDENLDAGPPADVDFVLKRVENILRKYGAKVLDQQPYHVAVEDGPFIEGVDVLAADPGNKGQVWVRGLLIEGDVYILAAWRAKGQVATDPEFVAFFDSFKAHGM